METAAAAAVAEAGGVRPGRDVGGFPASRALYRSLPSILSRPLSPLSALPRVGCRQS